MIKYRLKIIKSKGQIETKETTLNGPNITIGRGENVSIRLEDPLVSFKHAELKEDLNTLTITDAGSFSGTKVNNKPISISKLNDGDIISIGLYRIEIKREGNDWILVEERKADRTKGEDEFIENILKTTSFKDNLPSMTMLSIMLVTILVIAFIYIPLSTEHKSSWSSGPISNEHKLLASDCASCHTKPFEKVENSTCINCHKMNGHKMDIHANQNHESLQCTNCHSEHKGSEGLIIKEEELCLSCHKNLSDIKSDTKIANVTNFTDHPNFKVHLFLENTKVPLKDSKDTNTLKLNHEIHLKGPINGANKKEELNCASCHSLNIDKKSYQAVNFESSCQRCHPLGFSSLNPNIEAPHSEPTKVFGFLRNFYANEALLKEGTKLDNKNSRFIPRNLDNRSLELFFYRKEVIDNSRKAEHELFSKISCSVCHDIANEPKITENSSSFTASVPEVRDSWLPGAIFDHSSHEDMQCKDCHNNVYKSTLSSDILIPDVNNCKECHGDPGHATKLNSTCITCHPYHQSETNDLQKEDEIN